MRRRAILLGTAAAAIATFVADAAASARRIGLVTGGPPDIPTPNLPHFVAALVSHGWIEERDFVVQYRGGAGRVDTLPAIIAELISEGTDLIVVQGPAELAAAVSTTMDLPIVFVDVADPIALGAVETLARPGRNATGLSSIGVELAAKRLQFLTEAAPSIRRIGEIMTPGMSNGEAKLAASQGAAAGLSGKPDVVPLVVQDPESFEAALKDAVASGVEGLLVQFNAITIVHREKLVKLIAARGLPAVYEDRRFVDAGGLISYGTDVTANYRRAASFVDRILRGAKPGDLPVERAARFEMVINTQAARALGVVLPPSLLALADEVLE
jgi:putative tryptophan/tyrosine transport system substrate-binding protein